MGGRSAYHIAHPARDLTWFTVTLNLNQKFVHIRCHILQPSSLCKLCREILWSPRQISIYWPFRWCPRSRHPWTLSSWSFFWLWGSAAKQLCFETSRSSRNILEAPGSLCSLWQHHTKGLAPKKGQIRLLPVFGAEDLPIPVAAADVCRQGLADQDMMGVLPRCCRHVRLELEHQVGDATSDGEDWKILRFVRPSDAKISKIGGFVWLVIGSYRDYHWSR